MTLLERLVRRLTMEPAPDMADAFTGGSGSGGVTNDDRLFGGLVAAQATMAAQLTVDDFPLHSLHAYFLRPGRPDADIIFKVERVKEGRNFQVRNIAATQNGEVVFQLQASFQRPEPGVTHQDDPPRTQVDPTQLPNRDQLRGRRNWQQMPVDVRMGTAITADTAAEPDQEIWLRINGPVPEDPKLHLALVVYASDRTLLDTAWRPHAGKGTHSGASLDHSMWFHQPPRADDWLCYTMHSPAAAGARGLAFGAMYDRNAQRIVSVAQEGVLRLRPNSD